MTKNILAVESAASIFDAAERMKNHDVGFLAVIRGNEIVGVVTDRDIVVRGLGARTEPGSGSVEQVMTKTLYTCFAEDNVEDAIKMLEDKKIRRLLVLDDMERPVGVLSLSDLAANAETSAMSCEILPQVCGEVAGRHAEW